ncbi:MAG: TonB-dependent receptor [Bacteroidales bacterium]|nr:TonB-dependent receptor [Bacteroidales bacterium]
MKLKNLKLLVSIGVWISAMLLSSAAAFAQQGGTAKVLGASGEAVIGAAILIDGTTTGTMTDLDGQFTLDAKPGTPITVSCIGYKTLKTSWYPGVTITMEDDAELLEDAVVVGYGTQKKQTLTGAISVVKNETLQEKGSLSSPLEALQGQVPGVIITRTSSAPGDESWSMSLRGAVSTNSSEPLIIIDGVAYDSVNDLRLLNSQDIESMSFLKDASAAIYGSRAAGGVVLITTKKGQSGRAKVEYSGSVSMKTVGLMPTMMTIDQWVDSVMTTLENDDNISNGWYSFAQLCKQYKGHYINLLTTADPMNGYFTDVADFVFDNQTDWLSSLFSNSWSTSHDLSISGGGNAMSYRVSIGYMYDGSPLVYGNNNNQRYNIRLNNSFNITKWLTLDSVISYNRQEQVAPTNVSSMLTVSMPMPGLPMFSENGNPYAWGTWTSPASIAEYGGDNKLSVSAVNISETIKARATDWLDVNVNLGYNNSVAQRNTVNNSVNYYNYVGDTVVLTTPTADNSYYTQTSATTNFYSVSGYLNGHHTWNNHSLNVTAGAQYEFKDYTYFGVKATNIQEGLEIVNGSGTITISNNDRYQYAVASVYGRANYNYREKYLVEVNMRYDGSSKFQPENRWNFFWGASLGWRIGQEFGLADNDWVNELKLRLSYGVVGNQNGIDNYDGVQLYNMSSNSGALLGNGLASTIATTGTLASTARSWERIHNYNVGLDIGFFQGRLSGTVEGFYKANNNMLVSIDFPSVLGDTPPTANTGKFAAWGYEGQLTWRDKFAHDFYYHIGGTFTFARDRLVDYGGSATITNGYVSNREGYPLNALFGLRYAGKIENEEMLNAYIDKYYNNNGIGMPSYLRVGDNMFEDANGDGKLDENDYVYLGSADPEISFSFSAGLEWKGLEVSVTFQGAGNRTVWNGINNWTVPMRALYTNTTNQSIGNMWSVDNPKGRYPSYTTDSNINNYNYQASSWSASDGSYIRLKNVTIAYTMPSKLFENKNGISGCRFYVTGEDLWEFSHIEDGWDPEAKVATSSSATARYPFLRSYTFGVSLSF